ncbi:MAG: SsrA-binding protein SmpB [Candidatus Terrybacteria bacterium]|nr:SsrA-binding protein SmpB [Candidatus Terrybacteria bacterium]
MSILLENKKAFFDYEILETFEAGLVLHGWEVKSLKNKRGNLAGSRAIIRGGEIFLVGLDILPYQPENMPKDFEKERTIKLLLQKKEINSLEGRLTQKGLTVVPLKLYTKNGRIKIELALVKGKKKFEKRESIKKREAKREMERAMKSR